MANPHRGEKSFSAGEQTYTLRYSVNAICALEEESGKTVTALGVEMADPGKVGLSLLRLLLWAGLREHHADISLAGAGDILEAVGAAKAAPIIGEAFQLAFPKETRTARPPKGGRAGTGSAS